MEYPIFHIHVELYIAGELGHISQLLTRFCFNLICTERVIIFDLFNRLSRVTEQKILPWFPPKLTGKKHHTHTQHTTHNTKTRWAAASLPPAALSYISMATSAMAPNHGAAATHESVAEAWWWVCSRHGWFPWLRRQTKIHWKIEMGTGPQP